MLAEKQMTTIQPEKVYNRKEERQATIKKRRGVNQAEIYHCDSYAITVSWSSADQWFRHSVGPILAIIVVSCPEAEEAERLQRNGRNRLLHPAHWSLGMFIKRLRFKTTTLVSMTIQIQIAQLSHIHDVLIKIERIHCYGGWTWSEFRASLRESMKEDFFEEAYERVFILTKTCNQEEGRLLKAQLRLQIKPMGLRFQE